MFKIKKVLYLGLACVMLIGMSTISTFATESKSQYMENTIFVENGIQRQITEEEYIVLTTTGKTVEIDNNKLNPKMIYFDKFKVIGSPREYLDYSATKELTPWINGNEDGASVSYGESYSYSSSFSISLSTDAINTILSELGRSYVKSSSNDKRFDYIMHIGAGKIAKITFTPMKCRAKGDLEHWVQSESELNPRLQSVDKNVVVEAVKEVDRFADGIYELKYM